MTKTMNNLMTITRNGDQHDEGAQVALTGAMPGEYDTYITDRVFVGLAEMAAADSAETRKSAATLRTLI